ncbi:MAG: cytochrome c biogenesis protein CcsA [Hydrogenovibrio sp.]|uniref:cytochrome C assembly family protein n=1 Tax=Hydrogenovibrio sp. TaxID=2065821 RepID=UPI0028704770|nr:cytochrome c biogenesis protein CcsA [Hydrogenovibrio sp.]MDR9497926.1 cytochrome c biogenesis protein CcsA [Hydrogenovibrio sp.]
MTLTSLLAIMACLLYLYATQTIWQRFRVDLKCEDECECRNRFFWLVCLGLVMHFLSFAPLLTDGQWLHFNLSIGLSLISWVALALLLVTNINKPTENLGIFILPIGAVTVLLPLFQTDTMPLPIELGSHVLISIIAYSVMGLATAQAVLYALQEKRFQKRQLNTLFKSLPPLQVMEKVLMQLVLLGFVFLSFALLSGAFFLEDFFAQHLVHKTFFAILAWTAYLILLVGHYRMGWRGQKAATYTIWAYVLLVISYIGTQLVLQSLGALPNT